MKLGERQPLIVQLAVPVKVVVHGETHDPVVSHRQRETEGLQPAIGVHVHLHVLGDDVGQVVGL